MRISDGSSDVCSSDLSAPNAAVRSWSVAESCTAGPTIAVPAQNHRCDTATRKMRRAKCSRLHHLNNHMRGDRTMIVDDQYCWWAVARSEELKSERAIGITCAGYALALWPETDGTRKEENTSELQLLMRISYDVLCLNEKSNYKY